MNTQAGVVPYSYWTLRRGRVERVESSVIEEALLSIYVNGQDLVTLMCSPVDQEALALGFLYNEGVIDSLDEVGYLQANVARTIVDVFLNHAEFEPPRRMVITSGCGGGVTLQRLTETYPPLQSDFVTDPETIFQRMHDMNRVAALYQEVRGVHSAALGNNTHLLLNAEDVGRHNAIDKITGKALQAEMVTRDCLLLSSGRISSEMLTKARRMQIPVVVSRTSPTSISLNLAEAWNICIVGYVRRGGMRIYTHPQRLGLAISETALRKQD